MDDYSKETNSILNEIKIIQNKFKHKNSKEIKSVKNKELAINKKGFERLKELNCLYNMDIIAYSPENYGQK